MPSGSKGASSPCPGTLGALHRPWTPLAVAVGPCLGRRARPESHGWAHVAGPSRPVARVLDALKALKSDGVRQVVCTHDLTGSAHHVSMLLDMARLFDGVAADGAACAIQPGAVHLIEAGAGACAAGDPPRAWRRFAGGRRGPRRPQWVRRRSRARRKLRWARKVPRDRRTQRPAGECLRRVLSRAGKSERRRGSPCRHA